jgi:peptidoglycan-associated lipoprotein
MKTSTHTTLALLVCIALTAAGCAKQEVVKKDTPLASQQTIQAPAAQQQPATRLSEPPVATVAPGSQQANGGTVAAVAKLETVYFDFDQSTLRQDARDALSRNAALLLKRAATRITIEGHCDDRGTDEYNLALGERRAKSVAAYLTNLGVKTGQLVTISFGEEKPAVQGETEAAWSKNRRAEFVISQ